jgi:hypothetical protein
LPPARKPDSKLSRESGSCAAGRIGPAADITRSKFAGSLGRSVMTAQGHEPSFRNGCSMSAATKTGHYDAIDASTTASPSSTVAPKAALSPIIAGSLLAWYLAAIQSLSTLITRLRTYDA